MATNKSSQLKSSKGSEFSDSSYLDRHFQACQPEYEAMLEYMALKPGWRVLDAGCGAGSYLPQMSQILGKHGQIEAIDLAPENVGTVKRLDEHDLFACPVNVQSGNVTGLPFEDQSFDAVWCSAITQYLSDADLEKMLREFRRVLKPTGRLGIKDFLLNCWQWQPIDPLLLVRSLDLEIQDGNAYMEQAVRNMALPVWIKSVGFKIVKSKTFVVDRWQPLRKVEKEFITDATSWFAEQALANVRLSEKDKKQWQKLSVQAGQPHLCEHPDFHYSEGHIVVVSSPQYAQYE